jgi:hypothetical protein
MAGAVNVKGKNDLHMAARGGCATAVREWMIGAGREAGLDLVNGRDRKGRSVLKTVLWRSTHLPRRLQAETRAKFCSEERRLDMEGVVKDWNGENDRATARAGDLQPLREVLGRMRETKWREALREGGMDIVSRAMDSLWCKGGDTRRKSRSKIEAQLLREKCFNRPWCHTKNKMKK